MSTISELIETTQKYFNEHKKIECQGHHYLRDGLCGCYEILLKTTDDEIKRLLGEGKFTKKYKKKNKAKYILWLTMGKPKSKKDNPFYEKESCRIRMYARLLKRLEEADADIEDAKKFIDDYGIYAIANLKKLKTEKIILIVKISKIRNLKMGLYTMMKMKLRRMKVMISRMRKMKMTNMKKMKKTTTMRKMKMIKNQIILPKNLHKFVRC